jgi:sulfur-oxidizing protein SoxY
VNRRIFLQKAAAYSVTAVAVSAGLLNPSQVLAKWPKSAFESKKLSQAITNTFGNIKPIDSDKVHLNGPAIAENGASVALTVKTSLPDIESIAVFVEQNGSPLAGQYMLHKKYNGKLSLRVKMLKTSDVYVIAKAGEQLYQTKSMIKVTLGGCGG